MSTPARLARTGASLTALVTSIALLLSVAGPAASASAATTSVRHELSVSQSKTVAPNLSQSASVRRQVAIKAHCVGKNNHSVQWFGNQLKLDSCNTTRLLAVAGFGSAAIVGILAITGVGAPVAGAIAIVLGAVVGALSWCSANGTGIIIDESWAGAAWCAAQ